MPKRTPLTDAEREQRRAADRAFVQQAVEQLRSSDGWQRWLTTRRHFHTYSLRNQLLLAMQKPDATRVAGFKAWLALGYCVRRGEKALRIFAKRAISHLMQSRVDFSAFWRGFSA
jgi:N-terminal domain of anti-restriction factor ArdC